MCTAIKPLQLAQLKSPKVFSFLTSLGLTFCHHIVVVPHVTYVKDGRFQADNTRKLVFPAVPVLAVAVLSRSLELSTAPHFWDMEALYQLVSVYHVITTVGNFRNRHS